MKNLSFHCNSVVKLVLIFVSLSYEASAQNPVSYQIDNIQGKQIANYWITNPPIKSSDLKNEERYIVKFKEADGSNARQIRSEFIENTHQKFLNDVKQIEKSFQSSVGRAGTTPTTQLLFDYREAFNGMAIITLPSVKSEIEKLSYVMVVLEDKQVKSSDIISSGIIKAPSVWANFNTTGKNVSIGIIDTGIDYNHQDLGGGIGSSFKVKGGYDFVNNDSDPMDDNGHGTHVAGITAANGTGLKGVAPDANLYAFKVLGADGSGYDSWILAAIERVLDPDQNPATDDAMDVVNMSLGRALDPLEPISEAVNNAVKRGVVFVVAAGNDYNNGTIGTPAIAKDAITVGASDQNDFTAQFSSKGPTPATYQIKPDVAAPGVDIYSSFLHNSYQVLSGTSMATPHVTGAVALLLEKHPDWTPAVVKAALMGSTDNIHNEIAWNQGTGRINVLKAIQRDFVVCNGSISLGLTNLSQAQNVRTQNITIQNLSNVSKNFSLTYEGQSVNSGITISVSPSTFNLAANTSKEVVVNFTINTSVLPTKSYPEPYSGSIVTTDGFSTIKTPYAFLHTLQTKLTCTGQIPQAFFIVGIENPYYYKYVQSAGEIVTFLPAYGTYDIIALYDGPRYVIKEAIAGSRNNQLNFSRDQADNVITFKPLDKNGGTLKTNPNYGYTKFTGLNRNFFSLTFGPLDSIRISDQTAYKFNWKAYNNEAPNNSDEYYDVFISTPYGITESKAYSNDPNTFTDISLTNPDIALGASQGLSYFLQPGAGWTTWNSNPIPVKNPFHLKMSQNDVGDIENRVFIGLGPLPGAAGMYWETGSLAAYKNHSIIFSDFMYGGAFATLSNTTKFDYPLGQALPHLNTHSLNQSDQVVLSDFPSNGIFNQHYGERKHGSVNYELRINQTLLKQGSVLNKAFTDFGIYNINVSAPANAYNLRLYYNEYFVGGRKSVVQNDLLFDTRLTDKNPPAITLLSLESEGKSTNVIESGKPAIIKLTVSDDCWFGSGLNCSSSPIKSVSLKYKHIDSVAWVNISLPPTVNYNFTVDLPNTIKSGYYSLMVTGSDNTDNNFNYKIEPAFFVGTLPETVTLVEPALGDSTSLTPGFRWTSAKDAFTYTFQLSDSPDFSSILNETTLSKTTFTSPITLHEKTPYFWRVRANNIIGSGGWSASNFTTKQFTYLFVNLITPTNHSIQYTSHVNFTWQNINVPGYQLQVSSDSTFNTVDYFVASTTHFTSVQMTGEKAYFWRVRPSVRFTKWSPPFKFITKNPIVTLISPPDTKTNLLNTIEFEWLPIQEATSYKVDISKNKDFSTVGISRTATSSKVTITPFDFETTYFWRVKVFFADQSVESKIFTFQTEEKIMENLPIINYPNPFSAETQLKILLNTADKIEFTIVNAIGEKVNTYNYYFSEGGVHSIIWKGEDATKTLLPDGVYVGIITSSRFVKYTKMVIQR